MSTVGECVVLGTALTSADYERNKAHAEEIKETEYALQQMKRLGMKKGMQVVWKRIERLVDEPRGFLPLDSFFDPEENPEKTTGVVTGLARVHGKCVCVIASNPEVRKGAWLPGQPEKILRAQHLAELLHVPIMWLLECSGLDLSRQDRVYTGPESGGRIFFNNARLAGKGIPIIGGIFGTNPAGGGYHGISMTKRFAHKDASIAIGGAAILSGMSSSREGFDEEHVDELLKEVERIGNIPSPGGTEVHSQTGFLDGVYDTEEAVIDAMRSCVTEQSRADVTSLQGKARNPAYSMEDLYYILPRDYNWAYKVEDVIARLVDAGEACEYMPDYGPEVYCGLAVIDGFPVGIVANRQLVPRGYPEYADYDGVGGKLYRQGLIKMCKFVSYCNEHRTSMVWLQDTSGIDVGDQAEKAGLLGLGEALIHCIENADIPMTTIVLRRGHAASHYVMCGPQASSNAFTLATPLSEIMVMHKESAAMARYGRALQKVSEQDRPAIIEKMNALMERYDETARPHYSAKQGWVHEVICLSQLRSYLSWFVHSAYARHALPEENLWKLWPDIVEERYHASKQ